MATINLTALNAFMVSNEDGSIDHDASHNKLTEQLVEYELRQDEHRGLVADAVTAFFEARKGERILTPFIVSTVVGSLNADNSNYKTLLEATQRYIRANTGTQESGAVFGMKKGAGGGTFVWADVPPEAPKAETK